MCSLKFLLCVNLIFNNEQNDKKVCLTKQDDN